MSFGYDYKGAYNPLLTVGKIAPTFDIDKLGFGKFHKNTLIDKNGEVNGWIYSPQALAALFERIRLEKRITIAKKVDRKFDEKFKDLLKKTKNATFFLYFSHTEADGINYFHKDLIFKSAALEFNTQYQDADSGDNLSVFTITGKKAETTHLSGKDGEIQE